MPRPAVRSSRRRLPAAVKPRVRRKTRVDAEVLRTWLPPALGAAAFLILYVLGNLDVIRTPPALALDALLLALIVLFFPMRYAYRLGTTGRVAVGLLAITWVAAVYAPIYRRIYPAGRIASMDVLTEQLPVVLPAAGHGKWLDLVIEGHLEPGSPGSTRAARYRLTLADEEGRVQRHDGEFLETWTRHARGRRDTIDLLRSFTATRIAVANPSQGDLRVTELEVRGRAEKRLTLSLYPHGQLSLWVSIPVALGLVVAAAAFDRETGAGETAASLTIATAAALTATFAFQGVASPTPTFRELFGAVIVGALVGGPLGGLLAWLLQARRRSSRTTARAT